MVGKGDPVDEGINVLEGEFSARRAARIRLPRAAIWLAVAIAVLQMSLAALDAVRLRHERTRLEQRREAIFRDAVPEARAIVDPDLQMKRLLVDLKRTHGIAVGAQFLSPLSPPAQAPGGPPKSIQYANAHL